MYCLKLFDSVADLAQHLLSKHAVGAKGYFRSAESFANIAGKNYTLICSTWSVLDGNNRASFWPVLFTAARC